MTAGYVTYGKKICSRLNFEVFFHPNPLLILFPAFITTDCSTESQSASCRPARSSLCRLSPYMSPTLSPLSLSPTPPLILYFFFQEESGISCEMVDLDFLKCRVGFPFMRAQTKVAQTNVELNAQ